MSHPFTVIAFDADDTLWHSEDAFHRAELRFVELISPFVEDGVDVKAALSAIERSNLGVFGYGVKAFGLSMVQTATAIASEQLPTTVVGELIEIARSLLIEPVRLLPHVGHVLATVASEFRIVMITKGDMIHQNSKVERSGLAHHFEQIEIVIEKDPATYSRIIASLGVPAEQFCMVGNSVRSDILPVLAIGGAAVHVPYPLLWDLEQPPEHDEMFAELESLTELPQWLQSHLG